MFCQNCGKEIDDKAVVCIHCGVAVKPAAAAALDPNAKSKLAAGLLGIFLGSLGIHNFYLGNTNKAITQLLLGTVGAIVIVGPIISGIWGLIEGIYILTGKIATDATGHPLKD
ncbi:MAG TPA: hypothetical protein DCR44_04305 [Acholeplasmatales bacterium]|nr:hypothetical protein [Acholeplasmatales bacterium]